MHSVDVDGVELPSPLLAEAQLIACVISAVYFRTAQGTAPVHPDPPDCTTEANGLGSRYTLLSVPYNTLFQNPVASKQA